MRANDPTEIELLANYAHDSWSGWIKYMFSKCEMKVDGGLKIPKEFVERWERQSKTEYHDLPDSEKPSDRDEAVKILNLLKDKR